MIPKIKAIMVKVRAVASKDRDEMKRMADIFRGHITASPSAARKPSSLDESPVSSMV